MNPQENCLKYFAKAALIIDLIGVVVAFLCAFSGHHFDSSFTATSAGLKDKRRSDQDNR